MTYPTTNLLIIARFTGSVPSDAITLKCSECGCDALCRQSALDFATTSAVSDGRKLNILCDVCARPHLRRAAMEHGIEVSTGLVDTPRALRYAREVLREIGEMN